MVTLPVAGAGARAPARPRSAAAVFVAAGAGGAATRAWITRIVTLRFVRARKCAPIRKSSHVTAEAAHWALRIFTSRAWLILIQSANRGTGCQTLIDPAVALSRRAGEALPVGHCDRVRLLASALREDLQAKPRIVIGEALALVEHLYATVRL